MDWFREAKIGMFIDWGPYSRLAGEWNGLQIAAGGANAEWIVQAFKIPAAESRELSRQINPTQFNAQAWATLARDSGMRYLVITAKHHDGFAMYQSKVSDYNIVQIAHGQQPGCLINGRVGNYTQELQGDYQSMSDNGMPPGGIEESWEAPQTLNKSWGFNQFDLSWKDTPTVVRRLVEIVSKGGNYLLNVGPTGEGSIPTRKSTTRVLTRTKTVWQPAAINLFGETMRCLL